jgi:dihydroorotate dehydrogenase (fumarate)
MSIDLSARYGRLKLRNPIVVGACPLTGDEQNRAAIEAAGAGAIVLPSLFQEQVIAWNQKRGEALTAAEQRVLARASRSHVEAFCDDADTYLSIVNRACVLSSIPIIASLNGEIGGNWLDFAGELQEAGAAAIELNVHTPPPTEFESARDVEETIVELISMIGRSITVPLYVKLGHDFTSLAHLSRRLLSGAQGMVLFSRTPDIEICLDKVALRTSWGLTPSGSVDQSIGPIMRIHSFCPAMPLAVCGGIGSASDALKALLAGADVVMLTSAIYRDGPHVVRTITDGIIRYMESRGWASLADLQNARPLQFDSETERLTYIKSLASRPDANPNHATGTTPHLPTQDCDRWGHPKTTPVDRA